MVIILYHLQDLEELLFRISKQFVPESLRRSYVHDVLEYEILRHFVSHKKAGQLLIDRWYKMYDSYISHYSGHSAVERTLSKVGYSDIGRTFYRLFTAINDTCLIANVVYKSGLLYIFTEEDPYERQIPNSIETLYGLPAW